MRIFIVTFGSRGDVQPYIALGKSLCARGHEVILGAHSRFEGLATDSSLRFEAAGTDPKEILALPEARRWMESGLDSVKFVSGFQCLMKQGLRQITEDTWTACRRVKPDVILGSGTGLYTGLAVAHAMKIPFVQAFLQPVHPTGEFPSAVLPLGITGGAMFNYLTHIVGGQLFWQTLHPLVNEIRRDLFALPPVSPLLGPLPQMCKEKLLGLYGYSSAVLGRPSGWPESVHVTGYWFLDEKHWTPPTELIDFIDGGSPPVCVGFGSMADTEPERTTKTILDAVKRTRERIIFLSGWGGLTQSDLPENIFHIKEAPHAWLFPRCKLVVHHGGAGTSSAVFRAGIPSIFVPFFGDQFFWAARAQKLGVAPRRIPRGELSADLLADTIENACGDEQMRTRADQLGQRIRSENGCEVAADLFQQHFAVNT